jgi:hypothetical protein
MVWPGAIAALMKKESCQNDVATGIGEGDQDANAAGKHAQHDAEREDPIGGQLRPRKMRPVPAPDDENRL